MKYNFDFKVGDIVVDCVGQKGVISEIDEEVDEDGFRGFTFVYEDTNTDCWIAEIEDLSGIHRVGDYIFSDYDIDSAYDGIKSIDEHIARLQEERAVFVKGIEYIKQDSGTK